MSKKSAKSPLKTVSTAKPGATRNSEGRAKGQNDSFFKRNSFAIFLFVACFVVFGNSIFNGYALDDEFYTAGSNKLTQQGLKGISKIFDTRTFANNDGSGYSFRPVALVSFALEIQLFGEKPHVSHFINVLLYAITLVLLFGLLRVWFKQQGDWFAFFVCMIFLVHPLHTEVVANIKCRDELLSFLFSVCTLRLIFIRFFEEGHKWALGVAAVTFGLALLSKTSCVPLIVMLPMSLWFFGNMSIWRAAIYLIPLVLAIIIIKLLLIQRLPEMSRTLQGFENPLQGAGFGKLSATAAYVMGRFVWLHFIPYPLIFYYGLNAIPPCTWADPMVIISAVVVLALGVLTIVELRKKSVAGFGLAWCAANLLMFSNLFGPTPGLFAERFAYSASLGFVIALADFIFRFTKTVPIEFRWKLPAFSRVKWIFIGLAVVFSIRSIARNETWEDKETLYRHDVELVPESAKMNMLLATLLSSRAAEMNFESNRYYQSAQQYAQAGRQQEAMMMQDSARILHDNAFALFRESRTYYLQATDVFPDYYTAWSNLGTAYYFTREYRGGLPFLKKAIEIQPDYAEAYFNLGMSYEQIAIEKKGVVDSIMIDSSIYFFSRGLKADSSYVSSADQLSRVIYTYRKDSVAALAVLNKSVAQNPKSAVPWNAMSAIYFQAKDTASGLQALEMAAKLEPDNFNRHANLANYYYSKGNMEKANYYKALYEEKYAAYQQQMKLLGKKPR